MLSKIGNVSSQHRGEVLRKNLDVLVATERTLELSVKAGRQ